VIGPAVGIAFGMSGGCMWPLESPPPSVQYGNRWVLAGYKLA
jgi:hypothetical protein